MKNTIFWDIMLCSLRMVWFHMLQQLDPELLDGMYGPVFSASSFKYHEYSVLTDGFSCANPCLCSPPENRLQHYTRNKCEFATVQFSCQWLSYGFWTDWGPAAYQQTFALIGHLKRVKFNLAASSSEKQYRRKFLCFVFITLSLPHLC
jgi:hypothetical protein